MTTSGSEPIAFSSGKYEGPTPFDDVYTRMVDAMLGADHIGYIDYIVDPAGTKRRCEQTLQAALGILQQRAYDAISGIDRQQAVTESHGGREVAWFWSREDLEKDVLGLPGGPYVTEDDLTDEDM